MTLPHQGRSGDDSDADTAADALVPFKGLIRYEQQLPVRQVSYYLCGDIREPEYYTEFFFTLRTASDTDLIYLHLNSPGGDFNTGLQMINNILASNARVVTILEARAYSMAALIFLAGDDLIVHDNCQLMFHTYSGSFAGKGNEQQAEVSAVSKWFEKVMRRMGTPFMSEAEINKILKGTDVWMDSDEIRHRLVRIERAKAKQALASASTPSKAKRSPAGKKSSASPA